MQDIYNVMLIFLYIVYKLNNILQFHKYLALYLGPQSTYRVHMSLFFFQQFFDKVEVSNWPFGCFDHITGINGVLYYTPQILEQAGVAVLLSKMGMSLAPASLFISAITTFFMLPCIATSMWLMDISGRRYEYPFLTVIKE